MQIFYVDSDPEKCAQALCNRHVIKQVLESAQILCTTHRYYSSDPRPMYYKDVKFYKSTHVHHPCVRWCQQNITHYNWLVQHAKALCQEYTYRYNKRHKSQIIIELCGLFAPSMPKSLFIDPPQCMPDEYKRADSTVYAYRDCYWLHKRNTMSMKWTRRNPPEWWLALEALEQLTQEAQEWGMYDSGN